MRPKSFFKGAAAAAFALCLAPAFAPDARAADGNEGKWYIGANIPVMFIDATKTGVKGVSTSEVGGSKFPPVTRPMASPITAWVSGSAASSATMSCPISVSRANSSTVLPG